MSNANYLEREFNKNNSIESKNTNLSDLDTSNFHLNPQQNHHHHQDKDLASKKSQFSTSANYEKLSGSKETTTASPPQFTSTGIKSEPGIASTSTPLPSSTILITNNYNSQEETPSNHEKGNCGSSSSGSSLNVTNPNINKSSITIVTHKNADVTTSTDSIISHHHVFNNSIPTSNDVGGTLCSSSTSSTSTAVVLDRINICINNHFADSTRATNLSNTIQQNQYHYLNQQQHHHNQLPQNQVHSKNSSSSSSSSSFLPKIKNEYTKMKHPFPEICKTTLQQQFKEEEDTASTEPDSTTNNLSMVTIAAGNVKVNNESGNSNSSSSSAGNNENQSEHRPRTFTIGEDVLVQKKDGRYYLGTIVAVGRTQSLVKFDDNTQYWSSFEELSKLSASDSNNEPMCVVCKKINSADIVEVCENCGRGYHRKCTEGSFQKNGIWYCRRCTAPNGLKNNFKKKFEKDILEHKSQLPYDVDSLSWDAQHRVNLEQIYCYCGKNGEWYNRMLQCCKCEQWFHEECVSCLNFPIYAGDRFFVFACSMCNGGKEFLRRIEMQWIDIVHLILFNITKSNQLKYYHAMKVIVPYAIDNWPLLQLQPNMRNLSATEIRDNVLKTLAINSSRFKCGKEIKKGTNFWGLRSCIPPPPPKVTVPFEVEINDQHLQEVHKLKIIPLSSLVDIPNNIDSKMVISFCGENSDNESSITNIEQKSSSSPTSSDDELPLKRFAKKEDKKDNASHQSSVNLQSKINNSTNEKMKLPLIDANHINKNNNKQKKIDLVNHHQPSSSISSSATPTTSSTNSVCLTDSSDKSRDTIVDYDGTKEDAIVDVEETTVKCEMQKDNYLKHGRKRKSKGRNQDIMKDSEIIEIYDSSDETSSRGTLDLIIPPPKNFQGKNNPFRITPKKSEDKKPIESDNNGNITNNVNTNTNSKQRSSVRRSDLFKSTSSGKKLRLPNDLSQSTTNCGILTPSVATAISNANNAVAAGQLRIVRTVKRRLSAKDIMIGPNKEIKRRRLRRRSGGNVEVISTSTTTLQSLPKAAAYLPIRSDSKELPISLIRSSACSTSSGSAGSTNLGSLANVFSGRRLRQRQEKKYTETTQRRNSNSSIGGNILPSTSSIAGNGLGSPLKNDGGGNGNNQSDVSLTELQTSLNMYFGAANRIASGENLTIQAKRITSTGKVHYLIEWEGMSS